MSVHNPSDGSGYVLIDRNDKPVEYASGAVMLHVLAEKIAGREGRQLRIVTGAEFLVRKAKARRSGEHPGHR